MRTSSSTVTVSLPLQSPTHGSAADAGVAVGVGIEHSRAQRHPVSTVRYVQKPDAVLPFGHWPTHGRLSHANAHSPGAGVFGMQVHWSPSGWQVPERMRKPVHGRPSHALPHSPGTGVAVGVGGGVGKVQAISQQMAPGGRHSHVPQQQPHVVSKGQSGASGLHSSGVGVAVGVTRGTQRHIVHAPSDSHTFS
jgi:hypothetical protein